MANVGQAMYAPIPQPNSASASIEMSRPTLNALSTDVVFFWLPVYGILQRFAPAGEADVHFLVLVLMSMFAAVFSSNDIARVASSALKWWLMPVIFLHAVVSKPYFLVVVLAFVLVRLAHLVVAIMLTPAAPRLVPELGTHSLRVLLVADAIEPKCDGVAVFTTHAIKQLQELGHCVQVVTSIRDKPLHGATVHKLPGWKPPQYPEHSLTMPDPIALLRILFTFRPHVVHIVDENFLAIGTQLICTLTMTPCVWSHHTRIDLYAIVAPPLFFLGIWPLCMHLLRRWFASQAQSHLAVCRALKDQLEGAHCSDVTLWHSGTDVDKFNPLYRDTSIAFGSTRYNFTNGRPTRTILLHVGRLAYEKNLELLPGLLDDLNGLNDEHGVAHMIIVGDGPYRETLERDMKGKACTFLGRIPQDEKLSTIYASSDIFVSPSTTEAFALVFLEAMASGLPVIGPNAGGIPEAFVDGVEGYLFKPNDRQSLLAATRMAIVRLSDASHVSSSPAGDYSSASTASVPPAFSMGSPSDSFNFMRSRFEYAYEQHSASAFPEGLYPSTSPVDDHYLDAAHYRGPLAQPAQSTSYHSAAGAGAGAAARPHIKVLARQRAERLSWRETYVQAVESYKRAWAAMQ